jgi:hypothetical protein
MKQLILPFILFLLIFTNCSKKQEKDLECQPVIIKNYSNDTIFPSDYLMAYPGSWWKYSNGVTDSCSTWETLIIRTTNTAGNCTYVVEDQRIVPGKLNYNEGLTANNMDIITGTDLSSSIKIPLLNLTIGVFYYNTSSYHDENGKNSWSRVVTKETIEKLDSMEVGGTMYYDVLHIRTIDQKHYYHIHAGPNIRIDRYYAKNVGLIKSQANNTGNQEPAVELEAYYIQPY